MKKGRKKQQKADQAMLGYDPDKWVRSNGYSRDEHQESVDYKQLCMPPPVSSKHKFSHCQPMYMQVHRFLGNRKWPPAHPESPASGITGTELFALFDLCGDRTVGGMHTKDREATERARSRRAKGKDAKEKEARKGKRRSRIADAVVKPSMNDEIKLFKAIVRHITGHDLPEDQKS